MMSAAATAMAGDELLRNLSREDVISRTIESLRRVAAQVTEDEVTAIVDGFEITSDTYEADAIHRAVEESLRLWASRDQVGLTCTLKLSQEHTIEEQNSMKEELGDLKSRLEVETVTTRLAQQVILEDQESLKEELRQLKSNMEEKLADSEAKMKAMAEEKPQATQSAEDLLKRLADLEEQITKVMPKETEASKQKDAKTGAAKELTEEEKKEKKREDDAWGDLKSYDEAFEELQKDKEKNDLALFSKLSEEIREKHGVWEEARSLMPAFYSNSLARLGSSVKLNYQPFFKDINELFEFHKEKKPLFDKQVKYVAHETKGKALIPGMKGQPRCKAKAAFKYTDATGTSWHRCTDIVRATILYHDIRSMYEGLKLLDKLHKEGKMEIVEFNDRYLTPMPGNYRDLQLSVKIDGMISELQLNTRIMAYVKEHAGHRSFEVSRELVAAVKESDSKRCDDILSWGKELLGDESVQEIVNGKEKPVLHEAARQGNADLVSVFLHYKADVNLKDNEGQSALHKAMAGGYERATWALICSGAKFDADQKGMTPLMEGLLKLRVNPANEAVARCVSTLAQTMVAQGCFKRELEGLSARLEVFVQERLKQSSDLIAACKDCDLQKLDRLLRDWADPNSRDIAGDGLHAVHVALHGGRMDFSAERAEVLRRLLEFRASPDATAKMPEGQESTALEVALKSSNRKAHIGLAVLIQHGARHRKKRVMDYLQWTAKDAQEAEPRAVVRQFLATWRYVVDLDQSLMLKACPLELLLFRGYEAAKRCKVDEDVKRQAALHVASILYSHGHFFELEALLGAECNLQDFRVFVVSGAGGDGTGCNGEYRQVREENGKRLYKMTGGDAIIYWDYGRWSMKSWENSEFTLYQSDRIQTETPPEGQWFAARHEVSPPPVVSSRKDQEHLLDHVQQLEYWVSLAVAAESSEGKHAVLHAAVSCQALQDTAEAASVQRAALTVAGMLRGQQQVEAAEELLQHYAVEDFALTKRFHFYGQIPVAWRGDFLATSREARRGTEVEIYNGAKDFIRLKTLDIPYGIVSVALCQDLLAIGAGREVKIYDSAQDFLLLKTLDEATDFIWSLSFAGQLLAAGSEDNSVRVYDRAQEFVLVKTLQEASGLIRSVAWSQHLLAAGGDDKIVRIYDALQDFTLVKSLEEASDEVMAVAWSGGLLAAGGLDTKIRIYDSSQDYVLVRTLDRAPKGILSLSCCGNFLATGSLDCRVRIYDTSQDFIIVKVLEMPGCVPELAFHGSYLAVGAKSGREMSIFDAENLRWGAFEVDRLWDFAKRPEQQEEQSPSKHSAVKDAD